MDYYVDMTATTVGFTNWANVAPFEPERREHQRSGPARDTQTKISGATDFFDPVTGPAAPTTRLARNPNTNIVTELVSKTKDAKSANVEAHAVHNNAGEVDRIAKQRVRLMAAKYASGAESTEMVARLEILNRRLVDRAPLVSSNQVQALESAANQLIQARTAREARMKRLGIQI